ncbi:TPA: hypothetical protein N0F65_008205 [Lagenidium giganteum]|uniref:Uncharacterized protein n=1 Tax=Lagenidium giganteum TaxID=4803 RepID=A0AAV2YVS8_9STRA|nr:TPA: hypothetical protein N0F65_008205 [Lagenidium giganteum]
MVSNTSTSKKCPPNIRAPSVHSPVLVSPISVAHRNKMMDVKCGKKGANNWMRDQWVANLKKKRMQQVGGPVGLMPPGMSTDARAHAAATTQSHVSARNRNGNRNPRQLSLQQQAPVQSMAGDLHASMTDKDLGLLHPSMFFNDLGCFEIESQTFTRLTPTCESNGGLLTDHLSSSAPDDKVDPKKWLKPMLKKRSSALDPNQPKPRTPRRKLNCGNAFEDIDSLSSSPAHSYSSVGTPSNFNAEITRMWGPELDFGTHGYVDTFLDLPTPKSAEMPLVSSTSFQTHANRNDDQDRQLEQPKLIRATSIEQEGLSQYFEQANLGAPSMKVSAGPKSNAKKGVSHTNSYNTCAAVVDDCFGKMLPSHQVPSNSTRGRVSHVTPRGGRTGDNNFDHKNMPEFETLLEEYKFNDIDQDLDSFYLDTIESFGGELDLIS